MPPGAPMVRAWGAGAVLLIVLLAQPAHRTKSVIGAAVYGEQRREWASVGILDTAPVRASSGSAATGPARRRSVGLSSSTNRAALTPRTQLHSTAELPLRRSFRSFPSPAAAQLKPHAVGPS